MCGNVNRLSSQVEGIRCIVLAVSYEQLTQFKEEQRTFDFDSIRKKRDESRITIGFYSGISKTQNPV